MHTGKLIDLLSYRAWLRGTAAEQTTRPNNSINIGVRFCISACWCFMLKGGNTHALRVPSAHFAISFLSRGMELAMCKMASKLRCLPDQLSVVQRVKRGAELASK